MKYRFAVGLIALSAGFLLLRHSAPHVTADDVDVVPIGKPAQKVGPVWQGAGTCSAMGCHNANGPKGSWGSEYSTWIAHDPHARAYEVLFNDKSKTIIRNLPNAPAAHKNALCLNCHVHPHYETAKHYQQFSKEDGVSCESCHGPAEKWLTMHYKDWWQSKTISEKGEFGMADTKTIVGRARSCVDCHIGTSAMDVNHDLIAAGHPRLNFEFAAFHANLPHHWDKKKDVHPNFGGRADFETAAWRVGQLISARAALQLLAARAGEKNNPWPEFAEYDCFACHHQLEGKSWRQERGFGKRPVGNPPWNTWYLAAMPELVNLPDSREKKVLLKTLEELRGLMEDKLIPDRKQVQAKALSAARHLETWIARLQNQQYSAQQTARMFHHAAEIGTKRGINSWDEAAQAYLALGALHDGWKDLNPAGPPPALRLELKKIVNLLQFPPGQDSPGRVFEPKQIRQSFQILGQTATK